EPAAHVGVGARDAHREEALALAAVDGEHAVAGELSRLALEAHEVAELGLLRLVLLAARRGDDEAAALPARLAHALARLRVGRDTLADDVGRALERRRDVRDTLLRGDE